jgi:hypothetical protein
VFSLLEKGAKEGEAREMIDESSDEFYNYYTGLLMSSEVEVVEDREYFEELQSLLQELARMCMREKLDALSQEIKLAESTHEGEALERLLQEFQDSSRQLAEIESASMFSS